MGVLAQRRASAHAILKKLDIADKLLRDGQSTEIVGRVLYDDPSKPETAVGNRLYVEAEALAPAQRAALRAELEQANGQLGMAQAAGNGQAMLISLERLKAVAEKVQARAAGSELSQATASAPLGSVVGLGRSLFTDYLIGVELAGTALLVATIGAILIAAQRKKGLS
jgi:hypothetical protein